MPRSKSCRKKCPDKLAKRMQECMSVIRPPVQKKTRNNHNSSCNNNYNCDPNPDFMDNGGRTSIHTCDIADRQDSVSTNSHRNSFDAWDISDLMYMDPLFIPAVHPTSLYCPVVPDYLTNNQHHINIASHYTQNGIASFHHTVPSVQPKAMHNDFDINTGFDYLNLNQQLTKDIMMNTNSTMATNNPLFSDTMSPTSTLTPIPTPAPTPQQEPVESTSSNGINTMPSRPNPPVILNGPQYFQPSDSFRVSFEAVDADDSQFITLEELKAFLVNKDYSNFNDEAVVTIMGMFDKSKYFPRKKKKKFPIDCLTCWKKKKDKDYKIDSDEFPDMLAFVKNWDSYFKHLDVDGSGTLDFCEMNVAIKSLGLTKLSDTFMTQLVQKYVRTEDKRIHFDNFILACVTLCRLEEGYRFMKQLFGKAPGFDLNLEQVMLIFVPTCKVYILTIH